MMLCLDSTLSVHSVNTCLYVPCLQAFEPDLALTDLVLVGGSALADLLGIPKAIMFSHCGAQLWFWCLLACDCATVDDAAAQKNGTQFNRREHDQIPA